MKKSILYRSWNILFQFVLGADLWDKGPCLSNPVGRCGLAAPNLLLRSGDWNDTLFGIRLRTGECFYLYDECSELVGRNVPDDRIIHMIISMDHTIAQTNDLMTIWHTIEGIWILIPEP